jgi:hypothetical protein
MAIQVAALVLTGASLADATTIDWQSWTAVDGANAKTGDGTVSVAAPAGYLLFPIHFDGVLPFSPADAPTFGASNPGLGGFTINLSSVTDTSELVVGLGNFAYGLGWSYTLSMYDTSNQLMPLSTLSIMGSFDHTWGAYGNGFWNDDVSLNTTTGVFQGTPTGVTEFNTDMFLFMLPSEVGKLVVTSSGGGGDTINVAVGRAESVPDGSPLPRPAISVPLLAIALGVHAMRRRHARG